MMRKWFQRKDSPASPTRSLASDPATWLEAFQSHWLQALDVIKKHSGNKPLVLHDHVTEVFSHLNQMVLLLLTEVNGRSEHDIGPILDYAFTEHVFDKVLAWSLQTGEFIDPCKLNQLKLHETLIAQSRQPLLVHKPILYPMLKLLEECSKTPHAEVERTFVMLLNQICVHISQNDALLEFFFNQVTEDGPPKFLVFTLLIPYLYREENVGQIARDALLLILAVSSKVESVALFISEHSNFCPVLATGLSGLYSMLPRKLSVPSDDWHKCTRDDIDSIPSLGSFYSALEFCNAVVQVGHHFVQEQLLDYIFQGFLLPVMSNALHETALEEVISSTAYLQLFFETITEPALMRVFIKFLLTEQREGVPILDTLVARISSNSRLCLVSLSLFDTLLNLNCEDLMYELVLKYLMPCTHMMISQARSLRELDMTGRAADKFLSLIPSCCAALSTDVLGSSHGFSTLNALSSSDAPERSQELNGDVEMEPPSAQAQYTQHFQASYLQYLADARSRVQRCYRACACWSLPYDGETPDPSLFWEESSSTTTTSENSTDSNNSADSPRDTGFKRRSSIRSSVRQSNSYFPQKRISNMLNPSLGFLGISTLDLTLGQDDFMQQLDADAASERNRVNSVDSAGTPASALSTPRFALTSKDSRMTQSMPADYFKLAYDEELQTSDSQDESPALTDSSTSGAPWVLIGWSHIKDVDAFIEVLGRVKSSTKSQQASLTDNTNCLDDLYEKVMWPKAEKDQRSESSDSAFTEPKTEKSETTPEHELVPPLELHASHRPPPVLFKSSFKSPSIGPFLTALFHKLENMMQNSLYVNLHLTGVLARLACFPQPLLYSILLNHSLVFQPSVRALSQILSTIKHKVDQYACTVDNFADVLARGREFLVHRDQSFTARERSSSSGSSRRSRADDEGAPKQPNDMSAGNSAALLFPPKGIKGRSISHIFQLPHAPHSRRGSTPAKLRSGSLEQTQSGLGYRYINKVREQADSNLEMMKTKNVAYCAIVLEEFLKELAAISQEHSVTHVEWSHEKFMHS